MDIETEIYGLLYGIKIVLERMDERLVSIDEHLSTIEQALTGQDDT